jgi:hypothetical protein
MSNPLKWRKHHYSCDKYNVLLINNIEIHVAGIGFEQKLNSTQCIESFIAQKYIVSLQFYLIIFYK